MLPGPHDCLQFPRAEMVIPALLEAGSEFELLQLLLQAAAVQGRDQRLQLLVKLAEAGQIGRDRVVVVDAGGSPRLAV